MKKLQRFLSAVLCVVMIAAMVLPMSAAGEASVKELLESFDKDAYTVVEFGKDGKATLAEYQGGSGVLATHTVYDGVNATKLVAQDIAWATFAKSHIAFANNLNEFKEYGYMVVKYASESDKAYKLTVGGWGDGTGATFDVSAGKTGWTTSEALEISAACAAVSETKRSITSSSSTADTYIGDIVFFKNEADAQEYAKMAPYYLDPNGEAALAKLQQREENWETIKFIMMLIGTSIGRRQEAKPYEAPLPLSGIDPDLYYILDCSNDGNITLMDFAADGVYAGSYATYNGVDGVKLGAQKIWAAYAKSNATIVPLSFLKSNNYSCMVFRYASESESDYELGFGWGSFYEGASFAVPAGNTDWTLSDVLNIPDALVDHGASRLAIASTSSTADTYIADVIFFQTRTAAKQYVEQWNEYYAGAYTAEPCECPLCVLEDTAEGKILATRLSAGIVSSAANDTSKVEDAAYGARNSKCVEIGYSSNRGWPQANYRFGFVGNTSYKADIEQNDYKYAVVLFASESEKSTTLTMQHWGSPGQTVLVDDISVSGGKWVTSGIIETTDEWMAHVAGGGTSGAGKLIVYTGETTADKPIYIHSIVYFTNENDAKTFIETAPKFYNKEEMTDPLYWLNRIGEGEVYATTFDKMNTTWTPNVDYSSDANNNPTYGDAIHNDVPCMKFGYGVNKQNGAGTNCHISWTVTEGYKTVFTSGASYQYLVVTYATETDSKAYLKLHTWSPTTHEVVLADDISVSDGRWITSGIVKVEMPLAANCSAGKMMFISNLTDDDPIYVREIAFFSDYDDAEAYVKAIPEHYNGAKNTNSAYWLDVLGTGFSTKFTKMGTSWTVANWRANEVNGEEVPAHGDATYKGVSCVKFGYGAIDKSSYNANNAMLGFADIRGYANLKATPPYYKYAVAIFATESTSTTAWLKIDTNADVTTGTLAANISVSNGNWVASEILETEVKGFATYGSPKLIFRSNLVEGDSPIYVSEIRFFTNREAAEYFQTNAPAYYNSFN